MSDRILRALMQLFAIIASIDKNADKDSLAKSKDILESFLQSELSSTYIERYLIVFSKNLTEASNSKSSDEKNNSLQSIRILKICQEINNELTHRQKIVVILRILEFIEKSNDLYKNTTPFIDVIADSFHIDAREYELLYDFVLKNGENIDQPFEIINYSDDLDKSSSPIRIEKGFNIVGNIFVLKINSIQTLIFKYLGPDDLFHNGKLIDARKTHILHAGSTIRTSRSKQLFYSHILANFSKSGIREHFSYKVCNLLHTFKNGKIALQQFDFETHSGNLVGIMGPSGSGKTTLLNLMNGSIRPKFGEIQINNLEIHQNREQLKGCIGNVSQTDSLIENLTVYENLYSSARLSLEVQSKRELKKKIVELLKLMGLYEVRNLKVGSLLQKEISGGERKRLNIALELIREPSILFVDEPTSGLSSRDSEKIMDILKNIALSGKLVFIVVHQPSSDIFKLFDHLIILDNDGYPIYDGIPLNAIEHFKKYSYKGNHKEKECALCGNVNPEQIFNLIDAKIVDEFGKETNERKLTPKDWYQLYKKHKKKDTLLKNETLTPIKTIDLPNKLKQFISYFVRDAKSKYSNLQYVILNVLIAPFLAVVLSYFIKFYASHSGESVYTLYDNKNIPQYIFIMVIVGVFLGLNIAAEEINKDKKILFREKYLQLSRNSYLLSKISVLFIISAFQCLFFVLVGNYIMRINELFWSYWTMMLATTLFSILLGLIVSSTFKSTKVIYIAIPLIIIPQLLFSGAIVDFKNLHPSIAKENKVPTIGNLMVTRWAYEGLAVEQTTRNSFSKPDLKKNIEQTRAEWRKNYWVTEMRNQIQAKEINSTLIVNELNKVSDEISNKDFKIFVADLTRKKEFSPQEIDKTEDYLSLIYDHAKLELMSESLEKDIENKKRHTNKALTDLVLANEKITKYKVFNNEIVSYYKPVYTLPQKNAFSTHFFSPIKYIFGYQLRTFTANLIVILVFTLLAYLALYFDIVRKFLQFISRSKFVPFRKG